MSEVTDWIELLEGELDEVEMQALEIVIRQSSEERKEFLRLSRLRDAVAEIDPVEKWRKKMDHPNYEKAFTEKVMKAIRKEDRASNPSRKDVSLKIVRDSSSS